jgi:hypothetical protein
LVENFIFAGSPDLPKLFGVRLLKLEVILS